MMRWREMLMDYGQMYGEGASKTRSTRSGSSFFSVDGDLMAKRNADMELRRILEVHFRPLFQRFVYGGEKIACHDLRRVLRDPEYRNLLPMDKVHELIDVTDFNIGRSIKYDEFVRIIMGRASDDVYSDLGSSEEDSKQTSRLAKVYSVVCRNTAQQNLLEEKAEHYRCLPPPFFVVLVTLVQIVLYFWHAADAEGASVGALDGFPSNSSNNALMYLPTRRREAWRFLSYSLLHQGFLDLAFNVLIQVVLGVPLEMTYSWWRVAIVYTIGVIMGSIGQSVSDYNVGLVGGAGGAYALLGGHVIAVFQNRKMLNTDETEGRKMHLLCSVLVRFIVIFVIMALQVALAVYKRWFMDDIGVKIGIAAHVGGFFAGLTLGPAFLKDPKLLPWQLGASGILDFFLVLAVVGAAVIFNIVYDGFPDEDFTSLSDFLN
ncbi:rhomboid-like protein [Elysia marginata]|uniref:Rhomboid-like protein n=1 Tax=Elysia marginata TaxID=1093978 RepID=A0AAV4H8K2_9GAST|nr:rhomboid-like protein [Elysia marginata]